MIPLPLAHFFTRSLYAVLKESCPRRGRYPERTVSLSHTAQRDLQLWSTMLAGDGRLIAGGELSWCLHIEAAEVGYGGTLGRNMSAGSAAEVSVHGICSRFLLLKSITIRELMALRLSLQDELVHSRISEDDSLLLLPVDNMAFFNIVSNMVSSNSELMME